VNTRFGIYFIPDGDLYSAGSSLIGYDIRGQSQVDTHPLVDPAWQLGAVEYGFHLSITDAITIQSDRMARVEDRTSQALDLLQPGNRYLMTKQRVGFWRPDSSMIVMVLQPSLELQILHDVLVSNLHPLGTGSTYFDELIGSPDNFMQGDRSARLKTEQYYSPFIFDRFVPHFTCLHDFQGPAESRPLMESRIGQVFDDVAEVKISKLALVTQAPGEPHFRIRREFPLR
jgi:hypothetical protein